MRSRLAAPGAPIDATAFHRVQFPTSDGLSLEGIQLGTTAAWPYWILFCSASGMTIHMTEVQEQLRALRSFGYGVLSFDYRGFGRNAGEPTEERTVRFVEQVVIGVVRQTRFLVCKAALDHSHEDAGKLARWSP